MPSRGPYEILGSANSNVTSSAYLVADWDIMTIQHDTASSLTVQGNVSSGAQSALTEADWSNLTVITAAGIYSLSPGAMYIRALRDTLVEVVRLAGNY